MSGEVDITEPFNESKAETSCEEGTGDDRPAWPPCGVCNDGTASAAWCRHCPYYLCARCSSYHRKLRPTRNHDLSYLTTDSDSLPHEVTPGGANSQTAEEYSQDSGVSVVTGNGQEDFDDSHVSIRSGRRKRNAMVLLADVLSENRQLLLLKTSKVLARQIEIDRATTRLSLHESQCRSQHSMLQEQIHDSRQTVERLVHTASHSLIAELDDLYRSEKRLIEQQLQKLIALKESVESCCQYAQRLAHDACDAELVSMVTTAYSELAALESVVIPGPVPHYLQHWRFTPGVVASPAPSCSDVRHLIGKLSHDLSVVGRHDYVTRSLRSPQYQSQFEMSENDRHSDEDDLETSGKVNNSEGATVADSRDDDKSETTPTNEQFAEVYPIHRSFRPTPPKSSPAKYHSPRTATPSPRVRPAPFRRRHSDNSLLFKSRTPRESLTILEEKTIYSDKFDSPCSSEQSLSEFELINENTKHSYKCTGDSPCRHLVRLAYVDFGVNTSPSDFETGDESSGVSGDVIQRLSALEEENKQLNAAITDLRAMVSKVEKLENRLAALERGASGGAAPAKVEKKEEAADDDDEDDDDIDLFGSDDEEADAEAEKLKQERIAAYTAKKSKKPTIIAKSNVILDVKPWDDETDMNELEKHVRSIVMDGLLWGASKFVPLAYGIRKLQIATVIEDDKVSVDLLEEKICEFEDFVQSVDIAAFNKI